MEFLQYREKLLPLGNLYYLTFIVIPTRKIITIVTEFLYLFNNDSAFKVYLWLPVLK